MLGSMRHVVSGLRYLRDCAVGLLVIPVLALAIMAPAVVGVAAVSLVTTGDPLAVLHEDPGASTAPARGADEEPPPSPCDVENPGRSVASC